MRTGTSSIVVAAFIGPGTVLTCAAAGVDFGYGLAWVLLFSTATAFVLQSLTAGTGILAQRGLGEAIRAELSGRRVQPLAVSLVVLGLWIGCASFELGNLLGAAAGIEALTGGALSERGLVAGLGALAAGILLLDLRVLIRVFAGLVMGMSALFLVSLLLAPVDWGAALGSLVVPSLPSGSLLTVVALIGTTVVTYNLFLHPTAAKQYWSDAPDRAAAWRMEMRGMALFLPVGGLISFAILATGATLPALSEGTENIAAFAALLEPVAGSLAQICFGLGLFAAGLTSTLTAPLAAASGICEVFGWDATPRSRSFRAVWASVLVTGVGLGLVGWSPLPAIVAAQAANGLLLPVIAAFMLFLTVRQSVVELPRWYYVLGGIVTLVCAGLGVRTLWWVWQQVT